MRQRRDDEADPRQRPRRVEMPRERPATPMRHDDERQPSPDRHPAGNALLLIRTELLMHGLPRARIPDADLRPSGIRVCSKPIFPAAAPAGKENRADHQSENQKA